MRSGFLVLMALAGCHSCDSGYEIPAPSPLPPPPRPALTAEPPVPDANAAMNPCAIVTEEDASVLLGEQVAPNNPETPISCTYKTPSQGAVYVFVGDDLSLWQAAKPSTDDPATVVPVAIPNGEGWRLRDTPMFALHVGTKVVTVDAIVGNVPPRPKAKVKRKGKVGSTKEPDRVETVMLRVAARL